MLSIRIRKPSTLTMPKSPNNADIESALRDVVRAALRAGDDVTVNAARSRAEEKLDLEEGFLKSEQWKAKSKKIIEAAFEAGPSPSPSPPPATKSKAKASSKPAAKATSAKAGAKRKSQEPEPVAKKRKKSAKPVVEESDDEEEDDEGDFVADDSDEDDGDDADEVEDDEDDEEPPPKTRKAKDASPGSDVMDEDSDDPEPANKAAKEDAGAEGNDNHNDAGDESDMSELIDEPPKRKRQNKSASTEPKPAKTKTKTASSASSKPLDADAEEIKRLQGWLVKCGIRKVWGRELAKCDTPKDKIRHLKKMLTDAGMTGRFSAEKARQIKEARELQAELEAAQEFNATFGHKGSSDGEESGQDRASGDSDDDGNSRRKAPSTRPRKALPKGLVDFGDSGEDDSDY